MLLRIKELEFLAFGDLKVTVSRAKNFESFNAKSSFVAANPEGVVNTVGLVAQFLEVKMDGPDDLLFSNFKLDKGQVVWLDRPMKEDTAKKYLREALSRAGIPNSEKYTLHSLKTGSVSEARNSGLVSETEVNRHARWAMTKMVDRYHEPSMESLLNASRALSIIRF